MQRLVQTAAVGLLLAGTALHAGCGNSASGLTTNSVLPSDAPGAISNEDPLARPVQVAWTSARAVRCGFYFDPGKLRTSYLAYEAKQGSAGEQLGKVERTYDSTFKLISERVSANVEYCTEKKSAEIKADLQRHLAGNYTPNLPKPKEEPSCGFLGAGCASTASPADEKFNDKKFWEEQDRKRVGK